MSDTITNVYVTIPHLDIERKKACKVYRAPKRFRVWWDNEYGDADVDLPQEMIITEQHHSVENY